MKTYSTINRQGLKNMKRNLWNILGCLSMMGIMSSGSAAAAVKLGQSCALTGSVSFLGKEMHKGALAYFDGHAAGEVVLTAKDDAYEPERCQSNTESFLQEGVHALFGYVGTPTAKVAVPLANANKTLFFGAFSGADFLSDATENPYAFAVRASYDAEIENIMRHLKEDLGAKRIGIFVQRDDFGLAGVVAAVRAEKKLGGIKLVPAVPPLPGPESSLEERNKFWNSVPNYKRNSVSVGNGVRQIRGQAVDAVILVATARPGALAINQWRKIGFKVPVVSLAVGAQALIERLKEVDNVYVSQIVPDPWDDSLPIVKQYQQDMGSNPYDFISLEGYIAAHVLHQAAKSIKGEPSSEALKKSLEAMSSLDAGGIPVSFGPEDHRGMDAVYLTKAEKSGDDIKFVYLDKLPKAVPAASADAKPAADALPKK